MKRLSRNNNLRLAIIFGVTGLIALGHWALSSTHQLGGQWGLIVGAVLAVLGTPFLIFALHRLSD